MDHIFTYFWTQIWELGGEGGIDKLLYAWFCQFNKNIKKFPALCSQPLLCVLNADNIHIIMVVVVKTLFFVQYNNQQLLKENLMLHGHG